MTSSAKRSSNEVLGINNKDWQMKLEVKVSKHFGDINVIDLQPLFSVFTQ